MPQFSPLVALLIAGLIGELAFELYAWLVSPILFGVALQPANLVIALTAKFTGITLPYVVAFAIHFLIGAVGFAGVVWAMKKVTGLGYIASGALAGVALWFVAQGILAPVVGRSFMMGFGSYTQSSFVAHTGMTLILAWVWQTLAARNLVQRDPTNPS